MKKERFFLKHNYKHWFVVDSKDSQIVAGYAKKSSAKNSKDYLNNISDEKKITKMKEIFKTTKSSGHYIRITKTY